MALKPLQAMLPFGQFDGYDADIRNNVIKGGEVATLIALAVTNTDKAAADVKNWDGYGTPVPTTRPIVTTTLVSGSYPLFLTDDGVANYGTLFGEVIGQTCGKGAYTPWGSPQQLGPHTATGSGKITLWNYPGTYAVTLDATDTDATNGVQVTNSTLVTGTALYATAAGKLTTTGGSKFTNCPVVARFIEFSSNKSLVTTPLNLAQAYNSPSGSVAATAANLFTEAVILWGVGL
jgi:hypothetical protein